MKRLIVIPAIVLVVGLVAVWLWARSAPDQAADLLVAAGLDQAQAEALLVRAGQQPAAGGEPETLASGSIEGVEVAIVSETGGQIVDLTVDEGDEVAAGQALVQLDTRTLEAQQAQARAAVAAAEANLANVRAGTHPAQILAAEAALDQVIAQRAAAETAWQDAQAILGNPQELNTRIVEAEAAVGVAAAQIEQAQAQIKAAEAQRDRYRAQGSLEEKSMYAVYDYQVQAAREALAAAQANRQGTEQTLAALRALRDRPLAIISQVHLAEGQYNMAVAAVGLAQARLEELRAGPRSEEEAVALAQVAQAGAAVAGLQTRLDKLTLTSPIDGVVTSRAARQGEAALPGATLLTVADLDEVKLTIYVPEDELDRVYLGQQVEVRVDSFPDRPFWGTVSYISQEAEFTPKNVQTDKERVNMVFAVRVRLPNPEHLLKPGMPADALLRAN